MFSGFVKRSSQKIDAEALFFYKLTASGNDFIVVDGSQARVDDWPGYRIRNVCDRRLGVGADGLVLLSWKLSGNVSMEYFNSDGSPAPICGNALLCVARLAEFVQRDHLGGLKINTKVGSFSAQATHNKDQILLVWPTTVVVWENVSIEKERGETHMFLGNVGVPHLSVFVGDIQEVDVQKRGQALRLHPNLGVTGANVNFVSVGRDGVHSIRTYERGIEGETYACSTGSLVCAAALVKAGRGEIPIVFRTRLGRLITIEGRRTEEGLDEVTIRSEAQLIYTGVFNEMVAQSMAATEPS